MEMFANLFTESAAIAALPLHLLILVLSFIALVQSGQRLGASTGGGGWSVSRWLPASIFPAGAALIWFRWAPQGREAWSRYGLAIPGSLLAAIGLRRYAAEPKSEQGSLSGGLQMVPVAFLLCGLPGQVLVAASPLPPSTWINHATFVKVFHPRPAVPHVDGHHPGRLRDAGGTLLRTTATAQDGKARPGSSGGTTAAHQGDDRVSGGGAPTPPSNSPGTRGGAPSRSSGPSR